MSFTAIALVAAFAFSSCSEDEILAVDVQHTVTFETNGGQDITPIKVCEHTTVTNLPTSTKLGYVFVYWCVDETLETRFVIGTPIDADITLYAKYDMPFKVTLNEDNPEDVFYVLNGLTDEYRNQLVDVVIPDAIYDSASKKLIEIREIGGGAFMDDYLLTSIVIGSKVQLIKGGAFTATPALRKVLFAEGSVLNELADKAFERAHALVDIRLPESLTKIGRRAFCGCAKLKAITIPSQVNRIGREAFAGCQELLSLTVLAIVAPDMKDNSDVAAKDNNAVDRAGDRIFGELGATFTSVSGIPMINVPSGRSLNIYVPEGCIPAYTTEEWRKNGNEDPSKVIIVHDRDGSRKECGGGQWNYYTPNVRFKEVGK